MISFFRSFSLIETKYMRRNVSVDTRNNVYVILQKGRLAVVCNNFTEQPFLYTLSFLWPMIEHCEMRSARNYPLFSLIFVTGERGGGAKKKRNKYHLHYGASHGHFSIVCMQEQDLIGIAEMLYSHSVSQLHSRV